MRSWLLYLLMVLATLRGTWLMVNDKIPIIATPRNWLIRQLDPRDGDGQPAGEPWLGTAGRSIGYLLGCEWCMSIWVAAVVVWATGRYVSVPLPVLVALSASMITGLTAAVVGWGNGVERMCRTRAWLAEDDLRKRGYKMPTMEE